MRKSPTGAIDIKDAARTLEPIVNAVANFRGVPN